MVGPRWLTKRPAAWATSGTMGVGPAPMSSGSSSGSRARVGGSSAGGGSRGEDMQTPGGRWPRSLSRCLATGHPTAPATRTRPQLSRNSSCAGAWPGKAARGTRPRRPPELRDAAGLAVHEAPVAPSQSRPRCRTACNQLVGSRPTAVHGGEPDVSRPPNRHSAPVQGDPDEASLAVDRTLRAWRPRSAWGLPRGPRTTRQTQPPNRPKKLHPMPPTSSPKRRTTPVATRQRRAPTRLPTRPHRPPTATTPTTRQRP